MILNNKKKHCVLILLTWNRQTSSDVFLLFLQIHNTNTFHLPHPQNLCLFKENIDFIMAVWWALRIVPKHQNCFGTEDSYKLVFLCLLVASTWKSEPLQDRGYYMHVTYIFNITTLLCCVVYWMASRKLHSSNKINNFLFHDQVSLFQF